MKPILRKGIALVLLFLGVAITWFFFEFFLPHRTMYDSRQFDLQGDCRARKRVRDACHKILSHRIGNYYAAFWTLDEVGNQDSIPYLIQALKTLNLNPLPTELIPYKRNDRIICMYIERCRGSLKKLTGMDWGTDHEQWENWWKETGQYLPFDEEKGQLILQEGTE